MASFKGFVKGLGNLSLKAAPVVAAPFTAGMSLAATPGASLLEKLLPTATETAANVFSGAAGGMAGRRDVVNELRQQQQRDLMGDAYRRAMAGISRGDFQQKERQQNLSNQLVSALLEDRPLFGMQNVSPRIRMPGLTSSFQAKPGFLSQFRQPSIKVAPMDRIAPAQLQQAGVLENIFGGVGLGAAGLGAIGGFLPQRSDVPGGSELTPGVTTTETWRHPITGRETPVGPSPAYPFRIPDVKFPIHVKRLRRQG